MGRILQHVKFYELEVGQQVIVESDNGMKTGFVVAIANGPGNMFCSVEVDGNVNQYYFQKIYCTP